MTETEESPAPSARDEKLERIEKGLVDIQAAFQSIQKVGIHKDILLAYLHDKCKMSKKDIMEVLYYQGEFYRKLQQVTPTVKE